MRRSSRSVPANISEAWRKRRYEAAFVSKLNDAEGEAAETQTHIEVALRCHLTASKPPLSTDATKHSRPNRHDVTPPGEMGAARREEERRRTGEEVISVSPPPRSPLRPPSSPRSSFPPLTRSPLPQHHALLASKLRKDLENAVKQARRAAETGAGKALDLLAVANHEPWGSFLTLSAGCATAAGAWGPSDVRDDKRGTQRSPRLTGEVAYEQWHRMLFARYLAENELAD